VLASGLGTPRGTMAVDANNVYFVDATTTLLRSVPKVAGTPIKVYYTGGAGYSNSVAANTTNLYMAEYNTGYISTCLKTLFSSAATTHSAGQHVTAAIDRVAGTLTLSGFTTGNGTTTGTPWATTNGNLYVGMDATLANQLDGLVRVS